MQGYALYNVEHRTQRLYRTNHGTATARTNEGKSTGTGVFGERDLTSLVIF